MVDLHPENALATILVVEDEAMLMMAYEDAILDAGAAFRGAYTLVDGLAAATADVDVAILDIRLGSDRAFPIAYQLDALGIPFLFCSGTCQDLPADLVGRAPLVGKPVIAGQIVRRAIGMICPRNSSHDHNDLSPSRLPVLSPPT